MRVRFTCVGKINYCYHLDPCINCLNFFLIVRSTPCPHVKHGDEWGEPTNCDSGDNCPYCHTRTEQQFHPEVSNVSLQYHKPVHVTYTAISRKVVRKSARDNPERYCG